MDIQAIINRQQADKENEMSITADPIDRAIADHAAFVAGWTDIDRRIVAHDFLNWQFGMLAGVRAMVEGDRRDALIMARKERDRLTGRPASWRVDR